MPILFPSIILCIWTKLFSSMWLSEHMDTTSADACFDLVVAARPNQGNFGNEVDCDGASKVSSGEVL